MDDVPVAAAGASGATMAAAGTGEVAAGRPSDGSGEPPVATPTVTTAGCVVIRPGKGGDEVLVVWTGDYPDPTLPKGRVEAGESLEQCAVREVREETGYEVRIIDPERVTVEAYDYAPEFSKLIPADMVVDRFSKILETEILLQLSADKDLDMRTSLHYTKLVRSETEEDAGNAYNYYF